MVLRHSGGERAVSTPLLNIRKALLLELNSAFTCLCLLLHTLLTIKLRWCLTLILIAVFHTIEISAILSQVLERLNGTQKLNCFGFLRREEIGEIPCVGEAFARHQ